MYTVCRDLIMKHGVCIRVLGDLELLPPDVLSSVARAVNFSRNNDRAFLNVCFSYTSRNEMTHAVRTLAQGAADGMILPRSEIYLLFIIIYNVYVLFAVIYQKMLWSVVFIPETLNHLILSSGHRGRFD